MEVWQLFFFKYHASQISNLLLQLSNVISGLVLRYLDSDYNYKTDIEVIIQAYNINRTCDNNRYHAV